MKKFDEWWFPDNEQHLQEWMGRVGSVKHGRLTYQAHKYYGATLHCPPEKRRVAIDVGAHVGLWSWLMAHDFEKVKCFEPMRLHIDCWRKNMEPVSNVVLYEEALGAIKSYVKLANYTHNSSGDTRVSNQDPLGGTGYVPMNTIDSYGFDDVDFMKIDCEGYELRVLQGAEQTLLRCKPVVIVEQKGEMSQQYNIQPLAAVEYLKDLGARHISDVGGDYILGWC